MPRHSLTSLYVSEAMLTIRSMANYYGERGSDANFSEPYALRLKHIYFRNSGLIDPK